MTIHSQRRSLTRSHQPVGSAARPRNPVTLEDLLAVLLIPVYVLAALVAIVYWIVAAVVRGKEAD